MSMQLQIRHADGSVQAVPIVAGKPLRAGTGTGVEIPLEGPGVEPLHFAIALKDNDVRLLLNKGSAPVRLNGTPVKTSTLKVGDSIEIGGLQITLAAAGKSAPVSDDEEFGLIPLEKETKPAPAPAAKSPAKPVPADDEEFGLAPMVDDKPKSTPAPAPKQAAKPAAAADEDEEFGLAPLAGEKPKSAPAPASSAKSTAAKEPVKKEQSVKESAAKKSAAAPDEFGLGGGSAAGGDQFGLGASPDPLGSGGDLFGLGGGGSAADPLASPAGDPLGSPLGGDPLATPGGGLLGGPTLGTNPLGTAGKLKSVGPDAAKPKMAPGNAKKMVAGPTPPSFVARMQTQIGAALKTPAARIIGGMLFMGAVVGALALFVSRVPTGDDLYQQADQTFAAKSYGQAIIEYDSYLAQYPRHPLVEVARIKRGLAKLYPLFGKGRDWNAALIGTQAVLQEWGPLQQSALAQQGLSEFLPQLAAALVERARRTAETSPATLDQPLQEADLALGLALKHLPTDIQAQHGMPLLELQLLTLHRDRQQTTALNETVAKIAAAREAGELAAAYSLRQELLLEFPRLAAEPALVQALAEVGKAEVAKLRAKPLDRPALNTDLPRLAQPVALLLSGEAPPAKATGAPQVVCVGPGNSGTCVAFDSRTGAILWQRTIGRDAAPPQAIGSPAESFLLVDANAGQLLRVAAATGAVEWRQPLADPTAQPLIVGDRVVVTSGGGLLQEFNLEKGAGQNQYKFALPLSTGLAYDPKTAAYLIVAEHSNVYVVSAKQQACLEAFFLGHGTGSVVLPPLVWGDSVLLLEYDGLQDTRLHLLANKTGLKRVQVETIPGRVTQLPVVLGTQVWLLSDTGQVHSFKLQSSGDRPLQAVPKNASPWATPVDPAPRFLQVAAGRLWLAGEGVRTWNPKPGATDTSPANATWFADSQLEMAPVVLADAAVSVRTDATGTRRIAASTLAGKLLWETPAPTAVLAVSGGEAPLALTAAGQVFAIPVGTAATADNPAAVAQQVAVAKTSEPLQWPPGVESLTTADSTWFLPARGATQLLKFTPGKPVLLQTVPLAGTLACRPAVVGKRLAVAIQQGPIYLIELGSGLPVGEPFVPTYEAGNVPDWDCLVAQSETQFALVRRPDVQGRGSLLLFSLEGPAPRLVQTAEQSLPVPISGTLDHLDTRLFGVDWQQQLQTFEVAHQGAEAKLTAGTPSLLSSPPTWGPHTLGGQVYLGLASGAVLCLGADGGPAWQSPPQLAAVAGACLLPDNQLAVALVDGSLFRVAQGQVVGSVARTQLPLRAAPVVSGSRLLLGGLDGVVYSFEFAAEARP